MKASSYKRIMAYCIDLFIIAIISSLISTVIPKSDLYKEKSNELLEVMEDFSNQKITDEEYLESVNDISYIVSKESQADTIVSLVITIIYFVVLAYYMNGATIGKKMMHITVVSNDERRLTLNSFLLRSLLVDSILLNILGLLMIMFLTKTLYLQMFDITSTIFGGLYVVIIAMILFRKDGRGLHDIFSNTKVISTEEVSKEVEEADIVVKEEPTKLRKKFLKNKK